MQGLKASTLRSQCPLWVIRDLAGQGRRSYFRSCAPRLSIIKGILTHISATSAGGAQRLSPKIGHYDKSVDLTV